MSNSTSSQHHHAGHRTRPAEVVYQPEFRVANLARSRFAAKLCDHFVDHAHAARANRVPERLQSAARIHRQLTRERAAPFRYKRRALTLAAEAKVFVVADLGPGEAIVHF